MTSPSLLSESEVAYASRLVGRAPHRQPVSPSSLILPFGLFVLTLFSTTAVGVRYMYNFRLGRAPLNSDADILPYTWVFHHLPAFASGLPFSLTLILILLAHEFGHYFACRAYGVNASLPYLLPAPSLSGTFGAVIRLRTRVQSRTALIVIGAAGPIAGFIVAVCGVLSGLWLSTYSPAPIMHRVQAPLLVSGLHALIHSHQLSNTLPFIIPHPILVASWIGLLITALNLVPAGQLDGGHILYALSPEVHRWASRAVSACLLLLGIFAWVGWILWSVILLLPAMRHPRVSEVEPVKPWVYALIPVCALILICSATYQPFEGFSLLAVLGKLPNRYH